MVNLGKIEKLPVFQKAVLSLYKELGDGFAKHATKRNLVRHLPKEQRRLGLDVVDAFIKVGYLRKHRTDTFCWTKEGIDYAKTILFQKLK